MCLHVLGISEGIFRREMGLIKHILAGSIAKRDLFELEVVIVSDPCERDCC